MDGKFKVLSPKDLVEASGATVAAQGSGQLTEKFYVEVPYGVNCAEHIALDNGAQEYFVAGLDDGTVQIFDYTKNREKRGISRPVFKVQKPAGTGQAEGTTETRPADLDHPYDYFQESLYEHGASVTCIEKNFKDNSMFATGGRDAKVFVWKLGGNQGHDDVEFVTEIGKSSLFRVNGSGLNLGYYTSLKWFDENTLALSLSNGTLQMNDIRIKQGEGDTSMCKESQLSYKIKDGGAIWDTALWKDASGVKVICAEDSGKITLIDPRNTEQAPITLIVSENFYS